MIINEPKKVDGDRYREAQNELVGAVKDIKGVKSVEGFGSVSAPGISDLDFVIVVKESINGKKLKSNINTVMSEYEYLFLHPPHILTEDAYKHLPAIAPYNETETLAGSETELKMDKDNRYARMTILFDLIYMKWYEEALHYLIPEKFIGPDKHMKYLNAALQLSGAKVLNPKNRLNVRLALCRLNGFQHDIKLVENALNIKLDLKSPRSIREVRQNYFKENFTQKDIENITSEYLRDSHELLKAFVENQDIYEYRGSRKKAFLPNFNPKLLSQNWDKFDVDSRIKKSKEFTLPITSLPMEVGVHGNQMNVSSTLEKEEYYVKEDAKRMNKIRKDMRSKESRFMKKNNLEGLSNPFLLKKYKSNARNKIRNKIHERITSNIP